MLKYGLSPEYVLDKIQTYEINALVEYGFLKDRENWEQARLMAYVTAQCQSTKKIKITDIVQFPWEQKQTKEQTEIDKKKLEQVKAMAKEIIKNGII